ncbi:hypothetical protein IMCC1989_1509 [gamma proteobacterium IMCC1989]|nr:hypothetical protein IMCC1989_1509 [gamma proteobacterium IMCC1989]
MGLVGSLMLENTAEGIPINKKHTIVTSLLMSSIIIALYNR